MPANVIEQRKKEIEKGFEKMIDYLEKAKFVLQLIFIYFFLYFYSCRHAYIGRYFDENVSNCTNNCDFCKNPQKVKDGLKCLERVKNTRTTNNGGNDDETQLYGGGRKRLINFFFCE